MKIKKYQIDAFAEKVFCGNPAVVCPVDEFPEKDLMQAIASEHNLSETAFIVKKDLAYLIRWFTPNAEVELCGHATLASAFVIFEIMGHQENYIVFETLFRGDLRVSKTNGMYELDFPSTRAQPSSININLLQDCFNVPIKDHFDGKTDCLLLFASEDDVKRARPDMRKLKNLDRRGFIITSESSTYDFVSRFFAPNVGVPEDPVTGSAHTLLIPFWSNRLGKVNMVARQVSKRGGMLYCTYLTDRVRISGHAVKYSEGEIEL